MKKCLVENCNNLTKRHLYCDRHYKRWKRHGDPNIILTKLDKICIVCKNMAAKNLKTNFPLCHKHYGRWRRHGDPTKILIGEQGEGYITDHGYKSFRINGKQQLEHRMEMEKFLKRKLSKDERVHHRNGNRADNRLENLELWSTGHPSGQRIEDLLKWAEDIIRKYPTFTIGV